MSKPVARYNIRCAICGQYLSYEEMRDGTARHHFTPDTEFGPEESEWLHLACREQREPAHV